MECRRAQDAKRDIQVNPFALRSATDFYAPAVLRSQRHSTTRSATAPTMTGRRVGCGTVIRRLADGRTRDYESDAAGGVGRHGALSERR